jgi:hypothetical protein
VAGVAASGGLGEILARQQTRLEPPKIYILAAIAESMEQPVQMAFAVVVCGQRVLMICSTVFIVSLVLFPQRLRVFEERLKLLGRALRVGFIFASTWH